MAEKLMKYADAVKKFDPVIGLEKIGRAHV